nr:PASTA domain-containing protein [Planomonospora sp. ID67723]
MSALTVAGSVLAGVVLFLSGGSPPPAAEADSTSPVYTPAPESTASPGGPPSPGTGDPRTGTAPPAPGQGAAPTALELLVPDVRGADGVTAQNRLQSAGFYAVSLVPVGGGSVGDPAGWRVVSQTPEPNTKAESTRRITVELIEIPRF